MEFCVKLLSLPLWERGLKFLYGKNSSELLVAPLVGAWIEITATALGATNLNQSLPLWERGLKLVILVEVLDLPRRSPCGSVD